MTSSWDTFVSCKFLLLVGLSWRGLPDSWLRSSILLTKDPLHVISLRKQFLLFNQYIYLFYSRRRFFAEVVSQSSQLQVHAIDFSRQVLRLELQLNLYTYYWESWGIVSLYLSILSITSSHGVFKALYMHVEAVEDPGDIKFVTVIGYRGPPSVLRKISRALKMMSLQPAPVSGSRYYKWDIKR